MAACGSQEISRHLFYVQRPVVGIWNAAEVPDVLSQSSDVYVIARGLRGASSRMGTRGTVAQSRFTRRERNPEDRYTLFLVHRKTEIAKTGETTLQ